ncbi:hypothetical protein SLEP1_g26500 [Rubroshorea leprosula]|uniref:Uncharacterized protein n=1 Tax=Rubroshorea leprosula TaxID=152421 RepID=A0AAV5JM27_9ROSI|nr:hypothetical protein SLEP1_g26500 [Rubroshorea leprosula]
MSSCKDDRLNANLAAEDVYLEIPPWDVRVFRIIWS